MRRLHPKGNNAVVAAAVLSTLFVGGCRNQSTALSNPFMAPDRVPPPSTRAIPPGTAQPYYPGDPLPTTQSSTASVAPAPFVAQPDAINAALATTAESPISVPADNGRLRYPLPEPPPISPPTQPADSAAALPPPPTVGSTPELANTPMTRTATSGIPSPVAQASYTEATATPTASAPTPTDSLHGPWRPPQIPQPGASPVIAQAAQPSVPVVAPATQPLTVPAMPVLLRAVPSTAPTVATSEPPRIRFPSAVPSPASFPPGGPQTVQITPLPSHLMRTATAPQAPAVTSDGFRPRGSVR